MTSAIMILCLAWTLSGVCGAEYLNIQGFVKAAVGGSTMAIAVMPVIFFLISLGLAFATGTSWGTFGILIPISVTILSANYMMMSVCVGAILAGAVCGDHISPISDTTILSSAGAQCRHIDHVATQMPYALTVALCASVGYILSGITGNGYIGLAGAAISSCTCYDDHCYNGKTRKIRWIISLCTKKQSEQWMRSTVLWKEKVIRCIRS